MARTPASDGSAGVGKSGSPAPRSITSSPAALRRFASCEIAIVAEVSRWCRLGERPDPGVMGERIARTGKGTQPEPTPSLPSAAPGATIPPVGSPFDNRGSCDGSRREGRAGARSAGGVGSTACGRAGAGSLGAPGPARPGAWPRGRSTRTRVVRGRRQRGRVGRRGTGGPPRPRRHRTRPDRPRAQGAPRRDPRGRSQGHRRAAGARRTQARGRRRRRARVARSPGGWRRRRRGRYGPRRSPRRSPHRAELESRLAGRLARAPRPARTGARHGARGRDRSSAPSGLPRSLRRRPVAPSSPRRAGRPRCAERDDAVRLERRPDRTIRGAPGCRALHRAPEPGGARSARPAGRGRSEPVVFIAAGQLSYLRSVATLTPLALASGADRARDRAEALRERVAGLLTTGNVDAELALLDPLFERFDPAEVAAALLALQREAGSGTRDAVVTAPGEGARVRVFVGLG